MPLLPVQELRDFTLAVLAALGTPNEYAQIVCNSLVGANLAGHDSHGVLRLTTYAQWVKEGLIRPAVAPVLARMSGATAHVDGGWGWGLVGARFAAEQAIALARDYGVGAVTIDRCAHIGRMGEYVALMAAAGMGGMATCNHYPSVAPFGGRERMLGTNPFAMATPGREGGEPVVVDFATSGVAEGKLRVARAKGETVAPGLIVDREGQPSQTPADFYEGGALLPFGGHKGYGLGLMAELLGGVLSGAGAAALPGFAGANGTLMLAIDISRFLPLATFTHQAGALGDRIHGSAPALGFSAVLLPGEPESNTFRQRSTQGIPLPDATWNELQQLFAELSAPTH
jgi:LDH2 family malate/lactate/ureidoglycolate dehydrogenase